MNLQNIRIILVQTYHPGNIGSAARAMKTMGLSDLRLIAPRQYPDEEATSLAAGATDILESARVHETLEEAIADCTLVIGTSARSRQHSRPMLNGETCAQTAIEETSKDQKVAIIFGRERMGLSNEDLALCHYHAEISANPDYPILNLASAVQIISYELWKEANQTSSAVHDDKEYPTKEQLANFETHLELVLKDIGFLNQKHPGEAMTRMERFFNRTRMESKELRMWRGILSSIERSIKEP
jgi:tRNA (cytidine32/uridine32-2'-O)-methyltransferase